MLIQNEKGKTFYSTADPTKAYFFFVFVSYYNKSSADAINLTSIASNMYLKNDGHTPFDVLAHFLAEEIEDTASFIEAPTYDQLRLFYEWLDN
jgi:hypothetical protein